MCDNWIDSINIINNVTVFAKIGMIGATEPIFVNTVVGQFVKITNLKHAGNNGIFQIKQIVSDYSIIVEDNHWKKLSNELNSADVNIQASMLRNSRIEKFFLFTKHIDKQCTEYQERLINKLTMLLLCDSIPTVNLEMTNSDKDNKHYKSFVASNDSEHNFFTEMNDLRVGNVGRVGESLNEIEFIQALELTINNNTHHDCHVTGFFEVEGSINTLDSNGTLIEKHLKNEKFSLWFTVINENDEVYSLFLPSIILSQHVCSIENDFRKFHFTALAYKANDTGYTLQIDRFYKNKIN